MAKAYGLVVESLLERNDFVASMALLVHWLGQANRVGLQKGEDSFSNLARRWMQKLESQISAGGNASQPGEATQPSTPSAATTQQSTPQQVTTQQSGEHVSWSIAHKFFDYLEANADEYWHPPEFRLSKSSGSAQKSDLKGDDLER